MTEQIQLIVKMLVPSVLISLAIKYLAPSLAIAPTTINVLIGVFLPTVVVAIALGWHSWLSRADGDN
jgi:hypothetical protein